MLTRSELHQNPVSLVVQDTERRRHTVTTERVGGGHIRMSCTCEGARMEGWCRHELSLLCLRYDDVVGPDDETQFRFEDIVMGTPLADTADEVDAALADYERALKSMDTRRPSRLDGRSLQTVSERAGDLADAAQHLARTIDRLKKRLASGVARSPERGARFAA